MHPKRKKWIFGALVGVLFAGAGSALAADATLRWTPNEESDLNEYRVYYGTASREYGPYVPVPSGSEYTVEGLEPGRTYFFSVTAVDTSGNESGFSAEVSKAIAPAADTVAPEIRILQPVDGEFFVAQEASVTVSGTASDDGEIQEVVWSTGAGASGRAAGTGEWEIAGLDLAEGETVLTVAAVDAAGNRAEDTLRITYALPRTVFQVSNVRAASQKDYTVHSPLENGSKSYIDRTYVYSQVPSNLSGAVYIRTANDDKQSQGSDFLRFDVSNDAVVYVAHDDRISSKPAWFSGFADTGADLISAAKPMSIFRKAFSAGEIVLGGNGSPTANVNMYTVAVGESSDTIDPSPEPDPEPEPEPAPTGFSVDNVRAASGKTYEAAEGLGNGEKSYIDRSYTYARVPDELTGSVFIRTANDDKTSSGDAFLRFVVSEDAVVYVAYDDRIAGKPAWMSGFSDTGAALISAAKPMSIYRKSFPAGEVVLGGNDSPSGSVNMYTVAARPAIDAADPTPDPSPVPEDPLAVGQVRAASGEAYVVADGLRNGAKSYIDRDYGYDGIPSTLSGAAYIRTANDDKTSSGNTFLRFSVNRDVAVYVAHDDRISAKPSWLSGFRDTGDDLTTAAKPMSLYRKRFAAGEVVLGGNGASSRGTNQYTVILVPE